jgi:hypothetical protein
LCNEVADTQAIFVPASIAALLDTIKLVYQVGLGFAY